MQVLHRDWHFHGMKKIVPIEGCQCYNYRCFVRFNKNIKNFLPLINFHLCALFLIRKLKCNSEWGSGSQKQNWCQQMQKCHRNLWPRNNSLPKYTHTVVGLLNRYTAVCIDNSAVGQESRRQAKLPSRCHCQLGTVWHLVFWLPTFFPTLWQGFLQGLLK